MDAVLYVSRVEAVRAIDVEDYIEREWQRMQELTRKAANAKQENKRRFFCLTRTPSQS